MTTTEAVKMEEAREKAKEPKYTRAEKREIREMKERFVSEIKLILKAKKEWRMEARKIFNCGCASNGKYTSYSESDFVSKYYADKHIMADKCMVCKARRIKLDALSDVRNDASKACDVIANNLPLDYIQGQDGLLTWVFADGPMAGKVFYRETQDIWK